MPYTPGPYNTPHLYLNWGGKLPGNESWSVGIRLRQKAGAASVVADGETAMDVAVGPISAFHQRPETSLNMGAKLSFVKCNAIGIDGKYVGSGTFETVLPDLPGAMQGSCANQLALAATLETGFSRGPAHRGRIYLPVPSAGVAADGLIAAAVADQIATSCNLLLTQLRAALGAIGSPHEPAVFSRKLGAAGNRRVTQFRVGRVLDTQRRRRRSLKEDYQLQEDYALVG